MQNDFLTIVQNSTEKYRETLEKLAEGEAPSSDDEGDSKDTKPNS